MTRHGPEFAGSATQGDVVLESSIEAVCGALYRRPARRGRPETGDE
jgi:hypothetical protein